MKRIALFLTIAALATTTSFSQSLDEVLKNYFDAVGQEKTLSTTNGKSVGKMIQMGLEIPFVQYMAKPSNFKVEATFQGMTIIQVYNGTEGWSVNPFSGVTDAQPMGEDELKAMKYQADYEGMLWNWKEKDLTVTLEGTEEVEGTNCHKVKIVTPEKDEMTYFIDAENFVLLKNHNKMLVQGNVMESDTYYSNYQQKDGVAFPGKIETRMNGQVTATIVIESMEFDVELPENFFAKPTL